MKIRKVLTALTVLVLFAVIPAKAATPTPAAQAFIEPPSAVAHFPAYYAYRVSADGTGDITEVRVKIPAGATGVTNLSTGYPGASISYAAGEIIVTYAAPWNVFSNPNFDIIRFTAASDPGDKYYGSYLNGLVDAAGNTPSGFSQYVMISTSTPTFTVTPTHSVTPTITVTFLDTFTVTDTHTRTPTITRTPTRSNTPDWTKTSTPTITMTETGTPPTPTFTGTFTSTSTGTATGTSTATPTFTRTYTLTFTPTFTVTPTATVTNTIVITGIDVSVDDFSRYTAATGEPSAPLSMAGFLNIGGTDQDVTGVVLTFKDAAGADIDMSLVAGSVYVVDSSGNTISSLAAPASASGYFGFTPPLTVPLQNTRYVYVYADIKNNTFTSSFRACIESAADVSAIVPVGAQAGYSYPMRPEPVNVKLRTQVLETSYYDLIPPSVSTGQEDVYAFMMVFENPGGADYSAALLNSVTLTVKDSFSNPIPADSAISAVKIRDASTVYYDSAAVPSSPEVYCALASPVTVQAHEQKPVYFIVDITSDTLAKSKDFMISVETPADLGLAEYHYGMDVTVSAAAGFAFPQQSSQSLIQINASGIDVSHTDTMPVFVSTGQEDIEAMRLTLQNAGNTSTASAMVTRISFYINDLSDNYMLPSNVISAIKVMSQDGSTVYGQATVFTGTKINVNFTSPVIVPSSGPVALSVKVDAAGAYYPVAFRVNLNSSDDVYAVDANIFGQISVSSGTVFPKKSGAASIQDAVSLLDFGSFAQHLPAGLFKGDTAIRAMSFDITNSGGPYGAGAECAGITITVKNSSGTEIAADSAISRIYAVDAAGNTVGSVNTTASSLQFIDIPSPLQVPNGSTVPLTLFIEIPAGAFASDFVLSLETAPDISGRDVNSGTEAGKNFTPVLPWQASACSIYSSPATALSAGGDGNIVPVLVATGQPDVRFMIFDFYNPGTIGTADVVVRGITVTALDELNNVIAPASAMSSARIINASNLGVHGTVDLTSMTTPAPFYIPADSIPFLVPYSTTVNAYIAADIDVNATATNFKLRISTAADIDSQSFPTGAVVNYAPPGVSYPIESKVTTISAQSVTLGIGHLDLMPVSAIKGAQAIQAMNILFENTNSVPVSVTFTVLSVKDPGGAPVNADTVASMFYLVDQSGNTVASAAAPASSEVLLVPSYAAPGSTTSYLTVVLDIASSGSGVFYLEVNDSSKIGTLPLAVINPVVGEYFGGIKSSTLSIQEASFAESAHCFPNPVNPELQPAAVEYYIESDSTVSIRIFTITGKLVKEIAIDAPRAAGLHTEDTWAGINSSGNTVKSGLYIVQIEAISNSTGEVKSAVKKLVVLR